MLRAAFARRGARRRRRRRRRRRGRRRTPQRRPPPSAPPAHRRQRQLERRQPPQRHAVGAAAPSTGGFIQADPATNSLIITAPEPLYRQLRAMIDQLDARRAQVYVESLIVEVNADKAAEFGFQWQGLLGNSGDNDTASSAAPTSAPPATPTSSACRRGRHGGRRRTAPPVLGDGLNIGRASATSAAPTRWRALARFLQTQRRHQHPLDAEPA